LSRRDAESVKKYWSENDKPGGIYSFEQYYVAYQLHSILVVRPIL
jgi:hypothetical protein